MYQRKSISIDRQKVLELWTWKYKVAIGLLAVVCIVIPHMLF